MITIKQKDLTIKDFDKLKNNSEIGIFVPESDYGLAEIYLSDGKFELYENQVSVSKIDTYYPSSKTCSRCGSVKESLSLEERIYHVLNVILKKIET